MKKIILALSVLFATNAMAGVTVGTVNAVNVNTNSVTVEMSSRFSPEGCTHNFANFTLILPLTDQTKAQFSTILSANVSGKKARILYSGCLATLPKITRVDLVK